MNKYLSYSFLYDDPADLRCDFEIATDEAASMIGFLRSLIDDEALREELCRLNELMYHINPCLRTKTTIVEEELDWLRDRVEELQREIRESFDAAASPRKNRPRFVVPQGCPAASYSHIIRNKCKALVRLMYRHKKQGHKVEDILFDYVNLFSGYFYSLALKLNKDGGVAETEFISRVYS
ncbi:MAG: ATP--cob(I)alamin adenosyltransferase [Spirochaetaceae bacterium]|jgi:ATP:cob(I)alamin adenosyltransferase|nr:ATP--cob(I)alamin adenosyltransferase [Spirochaetaceae bacterium]